MILQDHTVQIGSEGFYAESCKSTQPFQSNNYDSLTIEYGLPRVYPVNILPRQMTFKVTDNSGDRQGFVERVRKIQGIRNIHIYTNGW